MTLRTILTYTETDEDERRICFLPVPDEGKPIVQRFRLALRLDTVRGDGVKPLAAGRIDARIETMTDERFVQRVAETMPVHDGDPVIMLASWDDDVATRMTDACLALEVGDQQTFDTLVCNFGLFE